MTVIAGRAESRRGDRITMHLDPHYYGGQDFTIEAHNNSPENVYIQSAKLNGAPLNRARIYHSGIVAAGKLEFEMRPRTNAHWAAQPEDAPPLTRRSVGVGGVRNWLSACFRGNDIAVL